MLKKYPYILQLIDKHRKALENNSKEVRLTMIELNNLVLDIQALVLVPKTNENDVNDLKLLIKSLLEELKSFREGDGGSF